MKNIIYAIAIVAATHASACLAADSQRELTKSNDDIAIILDFISASETLISETKTRQAGGLTLLAMQKFDATCKKHPRPPFADYECHMGKAADKPELIVSISSRTNGIGAGTFAWIEFRGAQLNMLKSQELPDKIGGEWAINHRNSCLLELWKKGALPQLTSQLTFHSENRPDVGCTGLLERIVFITTWSPSAKPLPKIR